MQKVVIDTNVIVSSLIQNGYPHLIVNELFSNNQFQLCISEELLKEYYEVLARPKFSKFQDFFLHANALLFEIGRRAIIFAHSIKLDLIADKDDNMILELADECSADFIITGNTSDFTFRSYKETKIVTPLEYWENYRPK